MHLARNAAPLPCLSASGVQSESGQTSMSSTFNSSLGIDKVGKIEAFRKECTRLLESPGRREKRHAGYGRDHPNQEAYVQRYSRSLLFLVLSPDEYIQVLRECLTAAEGVFDKREKSHPGEKDSRGAYTKEMREMINTAEFKVDLELVRRGAMAAMDTADIGGSEEVEGQGEEEEREEEGMRR